MSKKLPRQEIDAVHPFKRWLLQIALLIVILIPIYFGALWLYHTGKLWRARSLTREGLELLGEQKPAEGKDKMVAALTLASYDGDVLRNCAQFAQQQGDPVAMEFYRQLLTLPNPSRADKRAALRAFLLFGDLTTASALTEDLIDDNPETDDWVCDAQLLWQEKQLSAAVGLMHKALASDPGNRNYQLLLAQMLAAQSDDAGQAEALATFNQLAKGKDQASLEALIVISTATGLDKATLRSILSQLKQHPLQNDNSRFAAWELEARLGDRPAKVVLQEVVDYFKTADLPHKSIAARWLYSHDQPDLALELATQADSIESKDLFQVRLDALAHTGDWTEVVHELADTHVPISQTLVFLYRARAAQAMGDPAGGKTNWDRARDAATTEPGMLDYLADYALKLGEYDEAEKTYARIAQSPVEAEAAYTALVKLVAAHGSAIDLLEVLRQMTAALPEKPEAENDWAYLSLLLNQNVKQAAKDARQLVAEHPEMLAYRSTLALAYLRQSDFSGARKVYEGQQIDWQAAPGSWKMVYAVVLAANGNQVGAQKFALTINRSQLTPEERILLSTWLPGFY